MKKEDHIMMVIGCLAVGLVLIGLWITMLYPITKFYPKALKSPTKLSVVAISDDVEVNGTMPGETIISDDFLSSLDIENPKNLITISPREVVNHLGKRAKIKFRNGRNIETLHIEMSYISKHKYANQYYLSCKLLGGSSFAVDFKDIISLELEE